jgi:hypothetical protein
MTRKNQLMLLVALLLTPACKMERLPGDTNAPPAVGKSRESGGEIEKRLIAPESVMDHQAALGLDLVQKDAILKEVERAQAEMLHLQFEMSGEREKLAKLLDAEKADEAQVLAAAERVMALENRIKASHLTMLVRVKNALNGEQQRKLRQVRAER